MHGTFRDINFSSIGQDRGGEGWEPYIPWFFQMREVMRQLGHSPTLYVMRKHDGRRRLYRDCTVAELSEIEESAGQR